MYLELETSLGKPDVDFGVDRKGYKLIGYKVVEEGALKSRRGEFDAKGLKQIVKLGNAARNGIPSLYGHAGVSRERLSRELGHSFNFRLDTLADGRQTVRADLHFLQSRRENAEKVMGLAEESPDMISSSMVLEADEVYRTERGKPKADENGRPLPPLLMAKVLHGSDIVGVGDAVHGTLFEAGPDNEIETYEDIPIVRFSRIADQLWKRKHMTDRRTIRRWMEEQTEKMMDLAGVPPDADPEKLERVLQQLVDIP